MATRKTFDVSAKNTCKASFTFLLNDSGDDTVIEVVEITDREKPTGCQGHPRTIAALLKNRTLESVDTAELAECSCARECSCGQNVAACIEAIRSS